ncbi:MAG: GTPase Era [Candidatus Aminicenantia bacterium]
MASYKAGFVALIGRPNVGKSTLLNNILGQKVAIISDKPQTTRNRILGIKTTEKGQIIFVDNPGIHKPLYKLNKRMMSYVYSSLESCDLINLIIDATQRFGHGDEFVINILKEIDTPSFLLINKIDLIRKDKILLIIDRYKDLLDFKEIIPISALKGSNLDLLEEKIYQYLPPREKLFPDEMISDQSLRFRISEIIREKVLNYTKQELPYVTAVLIEKIEPKDNLTYIAGTIFVERDSHKKIVIGHRGNLIKIIGSKARQELELILGKKVFLDLKVKVKERWRDSSLILDLLEGQQKTGSLDN